MLQITFRHMETSPALQSLTEEKFERLLAHFSHAPRCHVVIDEAPGHAHNGAFSVHVELSGSVGEELHVGATAVHAQAPCAVREAFECVERQLHVRSAKRSA
jgi:ribosome-associated translation inhibitor RaiA